MRLNLERIARAVALLAMVTLLWRAINPPAPRAPNESATTSSLARSLRTWTAAPPASATLVLDSVPGPEMRGWLAAIVGGGMRLTWSATGAAGPTAISAEPARDPRGGTRLRMHASPGVAIIVRDDAGLLDSSQTGAQGSWGTHAFVEGSVRVGASGAIAHTTARDSVIARPILLLARAGWESKFTIAALEEAGWRVDANIVVAPDRSVGQGSAGAIDTSRYAAVIALDETAAPYVARLASYVRKGGGVIIGADASQLAGLASLLPARSANPLPGVPGAIAGSSPRTGLDAHALAPRSASVVLERRGSFPTIAAWRVGAGRLVQIGYGETWRWRMMGDDDAPGAHRAWWSQLVASVAYAPHVARSDHTVRDEAPWAATVAALGAPSLPRALSATLSITRSLERWLFAIVLLALLGEWGSRRLRGAP